MNLDLVFPVFAQIALSLVLLMATGLARFFSIQGGKVKPADIVLGQRNWPKTVQQLGNAANNQWETPTLFYAGVAFALILQAQSELLVTLAWIWVGLRVLHAAIYVAVNHLLFRFLSFVASVFVLTGFWLVLFLEVTA